MVFTAYKSSDIFEEFEVDLYELDDLLSFVRDIEQDVIIRYSPDDLTYYIEIYDTWRE